MRRLALAAVLTAAAALPVSPAAATCMPHYYNERLQISITSCSPPGGPVTTTYCVRDICYSVTSGEGPGGGA
jgi:hypothetical protein